MNIIVDTDMWLDSKFTDAFTPEDKLFWVFLLTNPYVNLCGCYKLTFGQMANLLGWDDKTVRNLTFRFENNHKMLLYDIDTDEILISNWSKYNWNKSPKFETALVKNIKTIKSDYLKQIMLDILENYKTGDTLCIPYGYRIHTLFDGDLDNNIKLYNYYNSNNKEIYVDTNILLNNNDICNKEVKKVNQKKEEIILPKKNENNDVIFNDKKQVIESQLREVIDYLNLKLGTRFTYKAEANNKLIRGRLKDYSVEDIKMVIDIKTQEWKNNPKMSKYLRPQTLFAPSNFESYINQKPNINKVVNNAIKGSMEKSGWFNNSNES